VAELDLSGALADLAVALDAPSRDRDPAARAMARIAAGAAGAVARQPGVRARNEWRRRLAAAAAVAAVVVGVLPGPRAAVARWLGIGSVRITTAELPADVGTELDLGRHVAVDDALGLLANIGVVIDLDAVDGDRPEAFVGRPDDAVTLVWGPRRGLREVSSGVGLLLTAFPGRVEEPQVEKVLPSGTDLEITSVNGTEAFWISGVEHGYVYVDPDGVERGDSLRLAGNTLLWVADGVTLRLESGLDRDAAIALAEALTRGG
jgi:hypothetical protein